MAERELKYDFGLFDWLNVILGIWLILSPILFRYSTIAVAFATEITLGVLILTLALYVGLRHLIIGTLAPHDGLGSDAALSWLQIPLGILVILAPFLQGYAAQIGTVIINNIVVGSLVMIVGFLVSISHQVYMVRKPVAK
jgi:hypothetical protein